MAHFYDVFYVQVDYVGQFVCLHFGYMCVFLSAPPEFGNSQCVVKTTYILNNSEINSLLFLQNAVSERYLKPNYTLNFRYSSPFQLTKKSSKKAKLRFSNSAASSSAPQRFMEHNKLRI